MIFKDFLLICLILLSGCGGEGRARKVEMGWTFPSGGDDPRVVFVAESRGDLIPEALDGGTFSPGDERVFLCSERPVLDIYLHEGAKMLFVRVGAFTGQGEVWKIPKMGHLGVRWIEE